MRKPRNWAMKYGGCEPRKRDAGKVNANINGNVNGLINIESVIIIANMASRNTTAKSGSSTG